MKQKRLELCGEDMNFQMSRGVYPCENSNFDVLNRLCYTTGYSTFWLRALFENIQGFNNVFQGIKTSDDYYWYCKAIFFRSSGRIAVLFPWSSKQGLDRSVAVFGNDFETCAEVVNDIVGIFWKEFFSRPYKGIIIPQEIFGREVNGRRIVPKWYNEDRAFLHPIDNDPVKSWVAAEQWFAEQGWEVCDETTIR